ERDAEGIAVRVLSGRLRLRRLRIRIMCSRAWVLTFSGRSLHLRGEDGFLTTDFPGWLETPAGESVVLVPQPDSVPDSQFQTV
ncbi:MAG: hypothetical protein K0R53_3356, partial [Burkholderiales bacterium]|nr:hypothetical protein [Burkholderiales bacterium]